MSRITQTLAYLNTKPSTLTNDWIKSNLTDITITEELKKLRKQRKQWDNKEDQTK